MSTAATSRRRDQGGGELPRSHATSPSTGQPRLHSDSSPKPDKRERSRSSGSVLLPNELFPLDGLLQQLLHQEGEMWEKNELLLQSLRPESASGVHQIVSELEVTDGVSLKSLVNSTFSTPTPDDMRDQNLNGLYFIRYGRLTNSIHKYFRRLERKHACLYLTARKAKHDRLRHVERPDHSGLPDVPPDVAQSAVSALVGEQGRQQTQLRDEDLLVYRCALMCAQFPMLSAPEPPDGQSPSPPPIALPLKFPTSTIGSPQSTDLSRTAPAEFLNTFGANVLGDPQATQHNGHVHHPVPPQASSTLLGNGSTAITSQTATGSTGPLKERNQTSKVVTKRQSRGGSTSSRSSVSTDRVPRLSSESPEVKRKVNVSGIEEVDGGARPNPSDPIPIRGTKLKKTRHSMRRDSRVSANGVTASVVKLPAGDSDEDPELVKLTSRRANRDDHNSDPFGREHPFTPMVNREMLCNLVRRSFDQSEEQQAMFEQSLRHEYGRRSKGEILAKELSGQLQVLENNAHPFYKPKLFVTRNGYDLWLQAEKQRVRSLIDKFWHYSLPRPQLWRHYNPTDYHRAYGILLQKIICCESRTERKEPAHAGRTPSAPLSPTAQRLLTEFGYRYGVGELYRKIVYLDYLARHFDYEVWYIKHCTEELQGIRDLLPRSRNKITAVRKEMEMLRATVHLLHGQTDNSLTRIDRLFLDSDPKEGVASLIELLAEVLDAEQSLFGKKVRPVEDWLKRYLKSGFVLRYERRKEIAHDETVLTTTAQPFVLNPTLVNSLLLDTRDEVFGYRDKFQSVFRPYFDVVPFSKMEFYRLLCADACSLCARKIHEQESRKSISLEMVGLMYRLNERDLEWQSVVPPELQLWRQHFVNLALIWMDVLGRQINQWTVSAVARDQWKILSFPAKLSILSENPAFPAAGAHFSIPSGVHPHFVSSIRPSPFPSPTNSAREQGSRFTPSGGLSGMRTSGAFTPYRQTLLKRSVASPISEISGDAGTDPTQSSSSSTEISGGSQLIAGEFPSIIGSGLISKSDNEGPLLKFGQAGRRGGGGSSSNDDELGFTSTVEPAKEIQVSASVYSGYEPGEHDWPDQHHDQHVSPSSDSSPASLLDSPPPLSPPQFHSPPDTQPPTTGEGITGTTTSSTTAPPTDPTPSTKEDPTPLSPDLKEQLPEVKMEPHSQPPSLEISPPEGIPKVERISTQPPRTDPASDGPIDVDVQIVDAEEFARRGLRQQPPEEEVHVDHHLPPLRHREDKIRSAWITRPQQEHSITSSSDFHPSLSIEALDPIVKPPPAATSGQPVVKFGNLLDGCTAEGSDLSAPKPRVVEPSKGGRGAFVQSTASNELHIPPASVSTVPELADWAKEHPRQNSLLEGGDSSPGSLSGTDSTDHADSQDTLKQAHSQHSIEVRSTSEEGSSPSPDSIQSLRASEQLREFFFPVSSSPMDIVTMLSRMASFTGELLEVLSPKLKGNSYRLDRKSGAEEYPSEVANAREHALQQQRLAESMRKEFLKKLHRVMISAFKLYADNILCMDLCCWPGGDASKLLGEQKVQNLKHRKDVGDIWGCRHMVEERHGLHPNGIPCQRKNSNKQFENITRDMCIRINNIHALITVFQLLEDHLYSSVRKAVRRPVSTFGYVSSDTSDVLRDSPRGHIAKPNPHRTRPGRDGFLNVPNKDTASWPSSISPSLGPMEPDRDDPRRDTPGGDPKREIPDYGFRSKESQRLLDYLKEVQLAQLRMLCIRMNNFFKPALSQLLELKLGECAIEKRLSPLITFLDRHRHALQKYIYPECYSKIMEYMWEYILQDLEEEAIKLRSSKRPVTNKAQMLLQSVSLMIQFMHNQESGIPLDLLTSTSEYLLGLLDIMTRSTDQLITIFNKLCAPQFTRSNLDLSRAPVAVDTRVLHNLRNQLHTFKKCFSGKEFVDKVLEIGRFYETRSDNPSEVETPVTPRRGNSTSRLSSARVFSPTGQPIEYTVRYAVELAQYLLNESILIQIPRSATLDSNVIFTPNQSGEEDGPASLGYSRSYDRTRGADSGRPLNLSGAHRGSSQRLSTPGTPQRNIGSRGTGASSIESRQSDSLAPYRYNQDHGGGLRQRNIAAEFSYTLHVFYKFADSEDADSAALYQSQILMASSLGHTQQSSDGEQSGSRSSTTTNVLRDERNDFNSARQGTLFLVYDLLVQRSRKERRARQFLQSPRALTEAERRRAAGNVNCDLIFKM